MKQILILRLVLTFFPFTLYAQEARIQLTEKVSIVFPEKPSVREMQDVTSVYTVRLTDSTANFNAIVSDLNKSAGLTSDVLETEQMNPVFWDQVQASFIAQFGPNAKVTFKEVIEVSGKKILKLIMINDRNGKKSELTVFIFVDDVYSINIVYTKRNDSAALELKDKFFASLKFQQQ